MSIINLKRVSNYEVQNWLIKNIKELTPYQIQQIREQEIVRFAPFEFMKERKKTNNVFVRLSVILLLLVYILLVIGLPFCYIITGHWGYKDINLKWFSKWITACGL